MKSLGFKYYFAKLGSVSRKRAVKELTSIPPSYEVACAVYTVRIVIRSSVKPWILSGIQFKSCMVQSLEIRTYIHS